MPGVAIFTFNPLSNSSVPSNQVKQGEIIVLAPSVRSIVPYKEQRGNISDELKTKPSRFI